MPMPSRCSKSDLNRVAAAYDKAGLQVELHAIGDRAIKMGRVICPSVG